MSEPKIIVEPPFELTTGEKQSALWGRLLDHLKKRETNLLRQNAGDLSSEMTWKARGAITELAALVALDADKPKIEESSWK